MKKATPVAIIAKSSEPPLTAGLDLTVIVLFSTKCVLGLRPQLEEMKRFAAHVFGHPQAAG
jgi:hypothetical protein